MMRLGWCWCESGSGVAKRVKMAECTACCVVRPRLVAGYYCAAVRHGARRASTVLPPSLGRSHTELSVLVVGMIVCRCCRRCELQSNDRAGGAWVSDLKLKLCRLMCRRMNRSCLSQPQHLPPPPHTHSHTVGWAHPRRRRRNPTCKVFWFVFCVNVAIIRWCTLSVISSWKYCRLWCWFGWKKAIFHQWAHFPDSALQY